MRDDVLSIVVPVFNEEESLRPLFGEITDAVSQLGKELDLIFVDDGSSDRSWEIISELAKDNPGRVRGIRFRKNFGKAAGLLAGFRAVRGSVTMTMDADLQDDPK